MVSIILCSEFHIKIVSTKAELNFQSYLIHFETNFCSSFIYFLSENNCFHLLTHGKKRTHNCFFILSRTTYWLIVFIILWLKFRSKRFFSVSIIEFQNQIRRIDVICCIYLIYSFKIHICIHILCTNNTLGKYRNLSHSPCFYYFIVISLIHINMLWFRRLRFKRVREAKTVQTGRQRDL